MRGFAAIGLDNPKTSANVGSALRAAGVYGAAFVATSGNRYYKSATDTMKHFRHLPLIQTADVFDVIPYDCVPVAVDLIEGAQPLHTYRHPRTSVLHLWWRRRYTRRQNSV